MNNDTLTNQPDLDFVPGKTDFLPLESINAETVGIRLLPAQLARVLNVSKQSVSTWVKSGRVILGNDGRVDPRQAIARLLATGDLSRLRIKILEPLRQEVAARDRRIDDLEVAVATRDQRIEQLKRELAAADDEIDFQDAAALGFAAVFDALQDQFRAFWKPLREAPPDAGLAAVQGWLAAALENLDDAGVIVEHFPAPVGIIVGETPAPASEEGAGEPGLSETSGAA
jgi:uncharacterized coiled-coil protein SlyX